MGGMGMCEDSDTPVRREDGMDYGGLFTLQR